jgi:hypothetical protein
MRRTLYTLILALAALGPALGDEPAGVGSDPLRSGPLRFRDQFVLSVGFLAFDPTPAEVAAPGAWELDAVWTTASSWALSPGVELELEARDQRGPLDRGQLLRLVGESSEQGLLFADGEVSRTVLAVRRGFRPGLEIELAIPLVRFSGGGLDGFIESFHDSAGLQQAGRLGARKDEFFLLLDTSTVDFTEQQSSSLELGDLVLSAKYRILDQKSQPLTLSVSVVAKLPTGAEEPLSTSGEVDLGARVLGGRALGSWSLHGSLGILRLGHSELFGLDSQTLFSGMAAAERVFRTRTSVVFQGAVSESPFEELEFSRIGERSVQFTAGIKQALGKRTVLFAGFTENLENFNNSADVNLHLGISQGLN